MGLIRGARESEPSDVPEVGTYATTEEKIRNWRLGQFLRMGFDFDTSQLLEAHVREDDGWKVDVRTTEKLLERGCPLHLAVQIML